MILTYKTKAKYLRNKCNYNYYKTLLYTTNIINRSTLIFTLNVLIKYIAFISTENFQEIRND